MPSYATISDLTARIPEADLIELTDDARTGAVDEAVLETVLADADAVIDGYVGRYYRRIDGTDPVPPLLVTLAVQIAHYRLFRFSNVTERVAKVYDQALTTLRDIAKGVITLDQGEEKLTERDGQILVESSDRLFTRDSMAGL